MPELPDVEVFKRYIDATSLHKKITSVNISSTKILDQISKQKLKDVLRNQLFTDTYRHGKYLFIHLDSDKWVVFHFGMTGFVKYVKDKEKKPSHTRLLIGFENSYVLALHSQRLLGKIGVAKKRDDYIKQRNLGPDALRISIDDFLQLMRNRNGMIKSTLMNQSIIAGIGNIYADEICFQTGIHPKTKLNQLNEDELKEIYQQMNEVFQIAIDAGVDPDEFPDWFIIPQRSKEGKCPKGNESLKTIKVNGRTTYVCPVHQKN